ncbi:CRISPR-associated helicase Cas3' [Tepidibacter sp.]|jgi:CRISPR-associated endonuclease/helicase Cas3|uniref:CRISPR-associated helicase Cas3' n=1 Tax=Tepidibacter sp. TaxID=2529387 RepID=UPI0025CD3D5C|nr:CRISPR-associated helicase Cas3' [Tepidibacter sp.]
MSHTNNTGGQRLVDHLVNSTNIALNTHNMHGGSDELEKIIESICMCHDFGKASEYFQQYLRGEYDGRLKCHGEISAYFAYYMLPSEWKLIGFMCVKRHHGNLEPSEDLFEYNKTQLLKIANSIQKNIKELKRIYKKDISEFFELIKDEDFLDSPMDEFYNIEFSIEDYINTHYLYSLLLTSDKTQLIRGEFYKNSKDVYEEYVKKYQEEVKEKLLIEHPEIKDTKLFKIRNQIYEEVINSIENIDLSKNHIFSINVPTGTSKTLAAYGGAFKLFQRIYNESGKNIIPSIIYAIPFTSIIDQNYEVLENILDKNNIKKFESLILKHHSMTPLEYKDNTMDEEKEYRNYDARFCVENWQSTIITTTFVQLFNTIFKAGKNSIVNRFHKLSGSIIILDEVQALDPKYYKIIKEVFDILCKKFNCYIITVTATKPLFLEGVELVKSNREIFKQLDRIRIENNTNEPMNLDDFCDILTKDIHDQKDKSFLVVLNTIKSSLYVLDRLNKIEYRKLLYLSTAIHPNRRIEIINEVKASKEKYILVSTQIIEAGVDIDFDIVYRDFSTMDSINQTGGRANRNAIKGKGILKIFYLIDENDRAFCSYIYPKSLLEATKNILKKRTVIQESEILDINEEYFRAVDNIKSDDSSKRIYNYIKDLKFNDIRKKFELIEDDVPKEDIIINYNEESQKCIDIILNKIGENQDIINAWKILNRYKISVPKKDLKDINDSCNNEKGMRILDKKYYDKDRGIKITRQDIC